MKSRKAQPDRQDASQLLESISQESAQMVRASDSPRGLFTCIAALSSVCLTLIQAYPPQGFWLLLLYAPLAVWYWLWKRNRARSRPLVNSADLYASSYTGYFFLTILLVNCLRFWDASQVDELIAKIVVTFIAATFLLAKLRDSYNKFRVEDSHGQSF